MRTIKIKKNLIPYTFDIDIGYKRFKIRIKAHTLYQNSIIFDLYDEDGNAIIADTKALYGVPLWYNHMFDKQNNHNPDYPLALFKFLSVDGDSYDVTYDNLEEKVFLTVEEF